MMLVRMAAERGASMEELDRYIAMTERYDAIERAKAFTQAKVALMAEGVTLTKDQRNEDFGNAYISLGKLVSTMAPLLSKNGLTADWKIDQSEGTHITVTCVLSHVFGHTDRVALTVPRDADDRKNELQAIKSSLTYARSMTYEAVCGLAATDASADDDGNGAGRVGTGEERETSQLLTNARLSAAQGTDSFQQFWKDCTEAQRRELAPDLAKLQKTASAVKGRK